MSTESADVRELMTKVLGMGTCCPCTHCEFYRVVEELLKERDALQEALDQANRDLDNALEEW